MHYLLKKQTNKYKENLVMFPYTCIIMYMTVSIIYSKTAWL